MEEKIEEFDPLELLFSNADKLRGAVEYGKERESEEWNKRVLDFVISFGATIELRISEVNRVNMYGSSALSTAKREGYLTSLGDTMKMFRMSFAKHFFEPKDDEAA